MFNGGDYEQRLATGELREFVITTADASPRLGFAPGTQSQIVEYRDSDGHREALVHRYLRPDRFLAASGLPDPKWLSYEGVGYALDSRSVTPRPRRRKRAKKRPPRH